MYVVMSIGGFEVVMKVSDALKNRRSIRSYLPKDVEREKLLRILNVARYSPSGMNTQSWQVAVVTGEKKRRIDQLMEESFRKGDRGGVEYQYYPEYWPFDCDRRRRDCGLQMYSVLGITREDKGKRADQWAANYRAFDAPVALYFFMDPVLERGAFIDFGMFMQSVMLAAVEEDLATCAQAALAEYPEIVKRELDYQQESVLVCGMALGYEDSKNPVNSYRTAREPVSEFARFLS